MELRMTFLNVKNIYLYYMGTWPCVETSNVHAILNCKPYIDINVVKLYNNYYCCGVQ